MGLEKIIQFGKNILPIGKYAKKAMKAVGTASLLAALASTPAWASEKDYSPTGNKNEIYGEVVLGNCLLQGTIAGFGGMQNGKPYWESFAKGCLGGALIAGGKIAVGNDLNNAWPAKITTALGTSIAYNASNGKPMDDSLGIDFGPAYFELKKNEFGNYKFKTYLLPDSLGYLLLDLSEGDKIDWEYSLRYGTPIMTTKKIAYPVFAYAVTGSNIIEILDEKGYGNELEIERNIDFTSKRYPQYLSEKEVEKTRKRTLRHELVHTHQYTSTRTLGNVFSDSLEKWFYKREIRKELLEPLHINLDHWIGDYTSSFVLGYNGIGNDSAEEREAYRLSNGQE